MRERTELETPGSQRDITEGLRRQDLSSRTDKGGASIFRKIVLIAAGILLMAVGYFIFKQPAKNETAGTASKSDRADRPVPVTVAKSTSESVPVEIRTIGNVLPFSVVNIVPQVGGQLRKVCFTQGQFVKKGDLLFQIDPQQYEATLAQALGNVARDKAQIEQAQANMRKDQAQVGQLQANLKRDLAQAHYSEVEVQRYTTLVSQGAISKEQADQMRMNLTTAQSAVEADRKAIENAESVVAADKAAIDTARGTLQADEGVVRTNRIQLSWTNIRSPIDGKTSSLNVYEGNVVAPNSATPMLTIAQIEPIYVNFTVPEQYLTAVRASLQKNTLKVEARIDGSRTETVIGKVSFLENSVNTTTGTVTLRAAFANTDRRLFPGQFVDVIVVMPPNGVSVVVPSSALQTTQQGTAVYVVKDDATVDFRPVKVARTRRDFAALSSGLTAGEVVVTDGQLQLKPGSKVRVVTEKPSSGNSGEGRRSQGERGSRNVESAPGENPSSSAKVDNVR